MLSLLFIPYFPRFYMYKVLLLNLKHFTLLSAVPGRMDKPTDHHRKGIKALVHIS